MTFKRIMTRNEIVKYIAKLNPRDGKVNPHLLVYALFILQEIRLGDIIDYKVHLNQRRVAEFVSLNTDPPPIVVCHVGKRYGVKDGYHRVEAKKQRGMDKIHVYVGYLRL